MTNPEQELAELRGKLAALAGALTRDHHGDWWVWRHPEFNRAADALFGRQQPKQPQHPQQRKGPRKPIQVIR